MPFVKGQSGNPAGRKPRSPAEKALRSRIGKVAPEIIDRMTEQAMGGDTAAAKLLLERCLPALRPVDRPVTLPPGIDLNGAPMAVLSALVAGDLTPDQAAKIGAALAGLAKVIEASEVIRRLESIEARLSEPQYPVGQNQRSGTEDAAPAIG
jgi:hypothetical protein